MQMLLFFNASMHKHMLVVLAPALSRGCCRVAFHTRTHPQPQITQLVVAMIVIIMFTMHVRRPSRSVERRCTKECPSKQAVDCQVAWLAMLVIRIHGPTDISAHSDTLSLPSSLRRQRRRKISLRCKTRNCVQFQ